MNRVHNKKRNSLLVYEFLVRSISQGLVEDDKKKSSTALKILKRHYKPGSELYKEFRLLNALAKTTVSSEHVAASILKEAKTAAVALDEQKLDREKSLLIRNINHMINDENFFDQHIAEYRTFASLQSLLNEWRSTDKDINVIAKFEDILMSHLVTEKKIIDHTITGDASGTARLLMKVMTKKLNEKYSGVLNGQQKSLIKAYAYSTASSDLSTLRAKMHEIKQDVSCLVESYGTALQNNDFLKKKLSETRDVIESETLNEIDDSTVTRFMLYARLREELETKE